MFFIITSRWNSFIQTHRCKKFHFAIVIELCFSSGKFTPCINVNSTHKIIISFQMVFIRNPGIYRHFFLDIIFSVKNCFSRRRFFCKIIRKTRVLSGSCCCEFITTKKFLVGIWFFGGEILSRGTKDIPNSTFHSMFLPGSKYIILDYNTTMIFQTLCTPFPELRSSRS